MGEHEAEHARQAVAHCLAVVLEGDVVGQVELADGAYLFAVKANQPELMADIATAFGNAFPPELTRAPAGADAA